MKFKIPYGVETATSVPQPKKVLKAEFGYHTIKAGEKTEYSASDFSEESMMLTGDRSIVLFPWATHYKVVDPKLYLFEHRNVITTFRKINESVLRLIVGDYSGDEAITLRRDEIAASAMTLIDSLCQEYKTGISVLMVEPQDVSVHAAVIPAFNGVNAAQQEMEKSINNAFEVYNRVIPKAKGDAEKMIEQAKGYAIERINEAKGNTSEFLALAEQHRLDPINTERRLFFEMAMRAYPRVKNKIIVDDGLNSLPLLNLTKGVPK